MGDLSWKIKQLFNKLMPFFMIAAIAYGAHYIYKHRTFRHGIVPGVTSLARKIPVFGSAFKRGGKHRRSKSYAYSKKRGRRPFRGSRRHHRRHR